MQNLDFWITLIIMVIIIAIVIAVKAIPKEKLPYCLGGDEVRIG